MVTQSVRNGERGCVAFFFSGVFDRVSREGSLFTLVSSAMNREPECPAPGPHPGLVISLRQTDLPADPPPLDLSDYPRLSGQQPVMTAMIQSLSNNFSGNRPASRRNNNGQAALGLPTIYARRACRRASTLIAVAPTATPDRVASMFRNVDEKLLQGVAPTCRIMACLRINISVSG
jgi:hypothetical protein